MTNTQLIILYLIGWIPMIYIGMRINDRLWRKGQYQRMHQAYLRGWNAGFGFLQKISDVRTERDSSVRVLK